MEKRSMVSLEHVMSGEVMRLRVLFTYTLQAHLMFNRIWLLCGKYFRLVFIRAAKHFWHTAANKAPPKFCLCFIPPEKCFSISSPFAGYAQFKVTHVEFKKWTIINCYYRWSFEWIWAGKWFWINKSFKRISNSTKKVYFTRCKLAFLVFQWASSKFKAFYASEKKTSYAKFLSQVMPSKKNWLSNQPSNYKKAS